MIVFALVALWIAPRASAQECARNRIPLCERQLEAPPPPGDLRGLSDFRRSIVTLAISQIGSVADELGPDCRKVGWQNLAGYYQASLGRPLSRPETETIQRVTINGGEQVKISDWCGIFALWAVKSSSSRIPGVIAGPDCGPAPQPLAGQSHDYRGIYMNYTRWTLGPNGGYIDGLPLQGGTQGIQPGDIVSFDGPVHHLAVVERVIGDQIYTIDGNQNCQMVSRGKRALSEVVGYYKVE